jgi:hypothetical protein
MSVPGATRVGSIVLPTPVLSTFDIEVLNGEAGLKFLNNPSVAIETLRLILRTLRIA